MATAAGDGGGEEEDVEEIVPELISMQGYPMHAGRTGVGAVPTRILTVTKIDRDSLGGEAAVVHNQT